MRRELGIFVALALTCLAIAYSNPSFASQSNVLNTTRQIAMLGIFAIGIAFVIITGGIDLSVGSIVGLTGVIIANVSCPVLEGGHGWSIYAGVGIALGVALLIGLLQGLLITRLSLQPFIVTLAGMLMIRGISQAIVGGGTLGLGTLPFRRLADTGLLLQDGVALIQWPVIIFVVVAIVAIYLLHFTVFGRYVYAVGGNRDAAEYSGIPVRSVETITYVISAGLAGIAGVCYAAYIKEMSHMVGMAYELYAIAAAVLGGCSLRGGEGTVIGVTIGSAMMRVIENGLNMFRVHGSASNAFKQLIIKPLSEIGLLLPAGAEAWRLNDNWQYIVIGAVILIAVILDQLVHIIQAQRRTRRAAVAAARDASEIDAAPAT